MEEERGYLTIEASCWIPAVSILLLLTVYLCSYLYQGCFLQQAAYLAAFRGVEETTLRQRESSAYRHLEEILQNQALSFGEESRKITVGPVWVRVELHRETPLGTMFGERFDLQARQQAAYRNPVIYIRGRQAMSAAGRAD